MEARPPALIEVIAARLIPPDSREHVLGDLHESYTTAGCYVRDVAALAPRLLLRRVLRLLKTEYGLYCAECAGLTTWFASNHRAQSLIPAVTMVAVLMLRDAYVDITEWPDTPEARVRAAPLQRVGNRDVGRSRQRAEQRLDETVS